MGTDKEVSCITDIVKKGDITEGPSKGSQTCAKVIPPDPDWVGEDDDSKVMGRNG